jgi:uncharacterized caspase-like protein
MRQLSCVFVALLLCWPVLAGVKRKARNDDLGAQKSAALFVGVRDFNDRTIAPVPYAVDDAIDLAYELTIDHQPPLVPPHRVVLALSAGEPVKPESKRKLQALLAAGVSRRLAEKKEILELLEAQSKQVGQNGILIVSFATHGVSDAAGTQHLLAADSKLDALKATVTDQQVSETVSRVDVPRSLILIDACRERLTRDRRGAADPRSAAASKRLMTGIYGQVVFSAAAPGGYAYDDDERQNGVFTAAVIDGLRCGAAKDWHGFITVETLGRYVSREVLRWIQTHKNRECKGATRLMYEGESRKMPLSICVNRTAAALEPPPK